MHADTRVSSAVGLSAGEMCAWLCRAFLTCCDCVSVVCVCVCVGRSDVFEEEGLLRVWMRV